MVFVVAVGAGSQEKVLANISTLGTNTVTVRAGSGFGARDAARIETLMRSDADAIALTDYAADVSPAVSATASCDTSLSPPDGSDPAMARILGIKAGTRFSPDHMRDPAQPRAPHPHPAVR